MTRKLDHEHNIAQVDDRVRRDLSAAYTAGCAWGVSVWATQRTALDADRAAEAYLLRAAEQGTPTAGMIAALKVEYLTGVAHALRTACGGRGGRPQA